ncbi:hypothetical protein NUSPORA_01033 [Nucleospora cyclopteri]
MESSNKNYFYYRNPMLKYTLSPQISEIENRQFICFIDTNLSAINIYSLEKLTLHFSFIVPHKIEFFCYNGLNLFIYSSSFIYKYYRDKLVYKIEVKNKPNKLFYKNGKLYMQSYQEIVNEGIVNEGIINEVKINEEISNEGIVNKRIVNEGIINEVQINNKIEDIKESNKILIYNENEVKIVKINNKTVIYKINTSNLATVFKTVDRNIFVFLYGNNSIDIYDIKKDRKIFTISDFTGQNIEMISSQGYELIIIAKNTLFIYNMKYKKIVETIENVLYAEFKKEEEIFIIQNDSISIFKKLNNKYSQYKRRIFMNDGSKMKVYKNNNIILYNKNRVYKMNIYKDEQNKDLIANKNNNLTDHFSLSISNNTALFRDNSHLYLIDLVTDSKKLFIKKTVDFCKLFYDVVLFYSQNKLFLVHKDSKRILLEKFNSYNLKDAAINGKNLVLLVKEEKYFLEIYKITERFSKIEKTAEIEICGREIREKFEETVEFIQSNLLIVKIGSFLSVTNLSTVLRKLDGFLYSVDESKRFILTCDFNKIALSDILTGIEVERIDCVHDLNQIKCIQLIDGLKYFMVLYNNGQIAQFSSKIKSINEENRNLMKLEGKKEEIEISGQFLLLINNSLSNIEGNKMNYKNVDFTAKGNFIGNIDLFKNCISKGDFNLYIRSLNCKEVNSIVKYLIDNKLVERTVLLLNKLMECKGKYIGKENVNKLLEIFEECRN